MELDEIIDNDEFKVFKSCEELNDGRVSVYDQGFFNYALLYREEPLDSMNDTMFYGRRIRRQKNQTNHLEALKKTFHDFVVVGINDESLQVEVKLRFNFPRLLEKPQYIFLSNDFSRLIEFTGETACLYDIKKVGNHSKLEFSGRVKSIPMGICDGDIF